MTNLERAVSSSGNAAFSMKLRPGFPADILSGVNPFGDGLQISFSGMIHPDDYQPFCEVVNDIVNGAAKEIRVHARLMVNNDFQWYYITGIASRGEDGTLQSLDGMMFNVSDYLESDGEDAVLTRYRKKHSVDLEGSELSYRLDEIVGASYLVRIQEPFSQVEQLYSAIIDTEGKVIAVAGRQDKHINLNKMSFQRKKYIRVSHQEIAAWIIASESEEAVNSNAQLLDTMVETVSSIANSYVVLVNEMENSQKVNRMLGQNIEDQILINNVYSLVLQSSDTRKAIAGILPLITDYFHLHDIMFCMDMGESINVYRWDKSGNTLPVVCETPRIMSINSELDYSGIAFTDKQTMHADHDGKNRSCALVRTYENGRNYGDVVYTAVESGRTWSNNERKLLKNVTQILSTVINKLFMEEELENSRAKLERLAYYDIITNIPNRSALERDFREEIRAGHSGAVIAFEISNLKVISEINGCDSADDILKSVAEYISALPSVSSKKVYHFSSDIIMITMSGADREEARQYAQAVLTKFRSPWFLDNNEFYLRIYAGITIYPDDAEDIELCIKAATHTLRLAKERGLEDAAMYSEGLEDKLTNNQLVKKNIIEAAENGFSGFYFLYRPVVDMKTGALHCCEANLLWGNDEMTVPRSQFLPIIDQLGLSKEIYRFVVDNVCKFCADVREMGVSNFRVSIAIPENILSTETSVEALRSALLEYSLPPSAISISVSEGARTLYSGNIFLRQLSKIGVNIIADDLGNSYFTSAPLDNPDVKTLKIRSERLTDNAVSRAFMQSVIKLAHSKGIAVCVRDVDTPATFNAIRSFDIDLVEGCFNGRPLRDKEFMEKMFANEAVNG